MSKSALFVFLIPVLVEQTTAQFIHNSTILPEYVDVYMSMNIRYGGICEDFSASQKTRIFYILI